MTFVATNYVVKQISKITKLLGVEVRRIAGDKTRTSMPGFLGHVARLGFRPRTVIDVGVGFGTYELYETFKDSTHLLIEPVIEFKRNLDEICGKYKAQYVIAAAGATAGRVEIHVHRARTTSSTLKETAGPRANGIGREVPVVTLDALCEDMRLDGPFLVKADAQGSELQVINGARKILQRTELAILEVSLISTLVGGPELNDVVGHLRSLGFVAYDLFGPKYRALDGALAQVDIAFVREDGFFRKSHLWS